MNTFFGEAINPRTEEIEEAVFFEDHFGPGKFGVQFTSDGNFNTPYYRPEDCAADPEDYRPRVTP